MSEFRERVIADLKQSRSVTPKATYQELQDRVDNLTQALTNIKNCPESDLARYCKAVDDIACEALTEVGK